MREGGWSTAHLCSGRGGLKATALSPLTPPPLAFLCCPGLADQDSVRLLAVEGCGAFAQALSKEDCVGRLLPVVQKFAQVRAGLPTRGCCCALIEAAAADCAGVRPCELLLRRDRGDALLPQSRRSCSAQGRKPAQSAALGRAMAAPNCQWQPRFLCPPPPHTVHAVTRCAGRCWCAGQIVARAIQCGQPAGPAV